MTPTHRSCNWCRRWSRHRDYSQNPLCRCGRRVVGNFFPGDPAKDAWVEARKAEGLDIPLYGFDVSDYEQCKAAVEADHHRRSRPDRHPEENNAGITRDKFFPMEKGPVGCRSSRPTSPASSTSPTI